MNSSNRYHQLSQWLHWLVASLILLQYILIELAERAEHAELTVKQLSLVANHKSIGITVLILAIVRLLVRLKFPAPLLPESMPKWQTLASKFTHVALYFLLFALPISGWLMSSANAYSVSYFNLFTLPDFIEPNKLNATRLKEIHEWLGDGLAILALLHVLAALKHHWLDKDDVLRRMTHLPAISVSLIALVAGLFLWGGLVDNKKTNAPKQQVMSQSATGQTFQASQLPAWNINYERSHIKFTGEQAGAPFTGTWNTWQAELRFDPQKLEDSSFYVTVDIESVYTDDMERDETIQSEEFFNIASFPQATFQASDFTREGDSYVASGELRMKGFSHPIKFYFDLVRSNQKVTLEGQAQLVRHRWNIGTGDWEDPTWVGSDVNVNVLVEATTTKP